MSQDHLVCKARGAGGNSSEQLKSQLLPSACFEFLVQHMSKFEISLSAFCLIGLRSNRSERADDAGVNSYVSKRYLKLEVVVNCL